MLLEHKSDLNENFEKIILFDDSFDDFRFDIEDRLFSGSFIFTNFLMRGDHNTLTTIKYIVEHMGKTVYIASVSYILLIIIILKNI